MKLFTRSTLTALASMTLIPLAIAQDYKLDATYGNVELSAGFQPDPHTVDIKAGGEIKASSTSKNCAGMIADAPDVQLSFETGSRPLYISVESNADTTLVINTPSGDWVCDDDSGGNLNPYVAFTNGETGVFDIWVGTIESGDYPSATMYFSELSNFISDDDYDDEYDDFSLDFPDDYFDDVDLFGLDDDSSSSDQSAINRQQQEEEARQRQDNYQRLLSNFSFPDYCDSPPRMISSNASDYSVEVFNDDVEYWSDCLWDAGDYDLSAIKDLITDMGGSWEWEDSDRSSWSWGVPSDCNCESNIERLYDFADDRVDRRNDAIDQMNYAIENHNSNVESSNFWNDLGDSIEDSFREINRQQQDSWNSIYNQPYVTPGYY